MNVFEASLLLLLLLLLILVVENVELLVALVNVEWSERGLKESRGRAEDDG